MLQRQILDPFLAQYAYLIGCQRSGGALIIAIGMTIGVWAKTLVPARALNVIFGLSVLGVAAFVILRNLSHS